MTTYVQPAHIPAAPAAPAASTAKVRTGRRRVELGALLALTALLYLWDLGASGYANDFYAAAVQAGTQSWKAFFFGSFDSSNFITVDKPPASLWPMQIAGRIFGFNSWSMLVPQAIEGIGSVWLLYAAVRRWHGHRAGLLAGALLALTPVAVLMFRFNNPDAAMVLLITLAAYCTVRAIDAASTRWLLVAGFVVGFSFLVKGLQPFTVLPALAIAYLLAAPTSWKRRIAQLVGAGVALVVGAGWWVLAVQLTPAADRPYIGGSGDNSALGLAFGYNGLSRLSGGSGPGGGGGFDGTTGIGRMFNALNGGQIAWLLPAALLAIVALVVVAARAPLSDRNRTSAIIWGGWLVITGAVLSFAGGIIHTYYTVELAPAIAALVAIGATVLWRQRQELAARLALAAGVVVSGAWSYTLLGRSADFVPWLRWVVLVASLAAAALLLVPPGRGRRALVVAAIALGLVALAGGPAAYAADTTTTAHTGSTPTAGPATAGGRGGFPGGGMRGFGGAGGSAEDGAPTGGFGGGSATGGFPGGGSNAGGGANGPGGSGSTGGFPGGSSSTGGFPGGGSTGGMPGGSSTGGSGTGGSGTGGASSLPTGDGASGGSSGAAARPSGGGFGGGATANAALTALLKKTTTTWAAATIGSQSAGPLELASGKAVMAIGGFSGSDAAPTLTQFEAYVKAGKIHYFVAGGMGGGGRGGQGGQGGQSTGSAISQWVAQHYTATTVGGTTVYDLTKASTS